MGYKLSTQKLGSRLSPVPMKSSAMANIVNTASYTSSRLVRQFRELGPIFPFTMHNKKGFLGQLKCLSFRRYLLSRLKGHSPCTHFQVQRRFWSHFTKLSHLLVGLSRKRPLKEALNKTHRSHCSCGSSLSTETRLQERTFDYRCNSRGIWDSRDSTKLQP